MKWTRHVTDEWEVQQRKLEFAKQTYAEVLDATKHQDDKVGRYLAALAFLTTGAIALLFREGILSRDFHFAGDFPIEGDVPLVAISALSFFACVLLSVGLLLLCLSTPLRVPGQRRERSQSGNPLRGSRLFFSYIGGEPINVWKERWNVPADKIQQELTRQYVAESHNLAERARSKYQHTNEAAALFVFALMFLGLALSLTVFASLQGDGPVDVGREVTVIVALAPAIYSGAILHSQLVYERQSMQHLVDAVQPTNVEAVNRQAATSALACMVYLAPIGLIIAALPEDNRWARFWFGGGLAVVLLVAFYVTRHRWASNCHGCKRRVKFLFLVGIAVVILGFVIGGPFQMAMLLVYPCYLFFSSVRESSRRHRVSQLLLLGKLPRGHTKECIVYR